MTHWVRGHFNAGRYIRPYIRRNPGSSGGSGGGGVPVVVAVAVAAGLAVTIGAVAWASLRAAPDRTPPRPIMDQAQAKTQRVTSNLDNVKVRWRDKYYQIDFYTDLNTDCVAHSYGKVQNFFTSDDCVYLIRASGEFRNQSRNVILASFSWVEMPTTDEATRLLKLVDAAGTGNVTELSRETGRHRSVRYTGQSYISDINKQAVWNAQVQPVGWAPAPALLDEIRDDVLNAALEGAKS